MTEIKKILNHILNENIADDIFEYIKKPAYLEDIEKVKSPWHWYSTQSKRYGKDDGWLFYKTCKVCDKEDCYLQIDKVGWFEICYNCDNEVINVLN